MSQRFWPHVVVGFIGKAGAGKSTLATAVWEAFKIGRPSGKAIRCEVRKFAAPIREMLRVVGVEKGDWHGETASPLFRPMAQMIGQGFRKADANFWAGVQRHAILGLSEPTVVLFDDVRYPNEAELCDLVVRLVTHRDNGLTPEQMLHESERYWPTLPADVELTTDDPGLTGDHAAVVVERIVSLWETK